jgi:predicted enzyme related to lactoylglutathione lyase
LFTSVLRDGIEIMLKKGGEVETSKVLPALKRRRSTGVSWDAYICVSDLDALYTELKKRRAKIIRKPEVTEYETREFAVEDCNGYVICFGQNIVSGSSETNEK